MATSEQKEKTETKTGKKEHGCIFQQESSDLIL